MLTDDADVYKPDGTLLCKLRQNVLSLEECAAAFPVWKDAAATTFNRGNAAGLVDTEEWAAISAEHGRGIAVKAVSGVRARAVKTDGELSNTIIAKPVQSGIVGYFDRNARFPYCRLTAYNLSNPRRFASVIPFIEKVDRTFAKLVPDRYEAQSQFVLGTSPDFFVNGTVFTTVTVNRNFQTAVHKDVGDLKEGFGVMSCLRRGRFDGCYFVFPKYRLALDMRTGCVLCADVHEWHGNSPIRGNKGMFERVSMVFYYRARMRDCGSAKDELQRVKNKPRQIGYKAARS